MVIADTSVWIEYFRGRHEPARAALRALIQMEQIALVGMVLAELLQGCQTPKEANMILTTLTGLRFLETSFSSWKRTGELSFSLRQKGRYPSPFGSHYRLSRPGTQLSGLHP